MLVIWEKAISYDCSLACRLFPSGSTPPAHLSGLTSHVPFARQFWVGRLSSKGISTCDPEIPFEVGKAQ